jgi:hypothetical protein
VANNSACGRIAADAPLRSKGTNTFVGSVRDNGSAADAGGRCSNTGIGRVEIRISATLPNRARLLGQPDRQGQGRRGERRPVEGH